MSLIALQSPVDLIPRKRTSSFSYPPPNKSPRMGLTTTPLRRTESYIISTDTLAITIRKTPSQDLPYTRTLQYYKDQREQRRRATPRTTIPRTTVKQLTQNVPIKPVKPRPPPPTRSLPSPPSPSVPIHSLLAPSSPTRPTAVSPRQSPTTPRTTSPLSPTPHTAPSRPSFPRSKPEPDLYRKALRTHMKSSPEGLKILRMGPHLAVSMMKATRELEELVEAAEGRERDGEGDVVMQDVSEPEAPPLTKSWVVVPVEDWEMVDCTTP